MRNAHLEAFVVAAIGLTGLTGCLFESKHLEVIADSAEEKRTDDLIVLNDKQLSIAQLQTCPVTKRNLSQQLKFSSVVEPPFDETGIVSSPMSGVVSRVLVDVGDVVRKGQPLLYVSSPDLADAQSNYFNALSRLEQTKAERELIGTRICLCEKEVLRCEGLVNEGISAKKDLESSQAKLASMKAEMIASKASSNAAIAQLNAARVRLNALGIKNPTPEPQQFTSELPIPSPRNGTVIRRNVVAGQGVTPFQPVFSTLNNNLATSAVVSGRSEGLLAIAELKKVWVMLEVSQSQAAKLHLNCKVKFETEVAPGVEFDGRVTQLGQSFDPTSHFVSVRTEVDNSRGTLKPGMMIIAKVQVDSQVAPGLVLKTSSIQTLGGKDFVFVEVAHGRFKPIQVFRKATANEETIVTGNLKEAEEIVTNGSFFLKTEAVKARN